MKAITIYQPYANLIITGMKKIETRPRKTNIRGTIAIHAGMKDPCIVLKDIPEETKDFIIELQHKEPMNKEVQMLGAIIGTVDIVNCVPVEEIKSKLTEQEINLGDYAMGRFAWILEKPVIFEKPILIKGKQGWWNWNNE